jgi:lipid-binding SYLF domain-containing protein
MIKGGFVFGGRYGRGAVSCRKGEGGPWGPPSMVTLAGGSFGLQIGGAEVDVVMLVMNASGIDKLLQDKFTLGGDASAAAGPVGRAATAETDAQMSAKILTYSRSRGFFAGLELKGAVLTQDRDGNRRLYRRPVEARDLLVAGSGTVPPAASRMISELARFSPSRSKKPL